MLQAQTSRFGIPSDGQEAEEHEGEEEVAPLGNRARTKAASHPAPSPPAGPEHPDVKEPAGNAVKGILNNMPCLFRTS